MEIVSKSKLVVLFINAMNAAQLVDDTSTMMIITLKKSHLFKVFFCVP